MVRTKPKYRATVHTMEIEPIMTPEHADDKWEWWQMVHDMKKDYIGKKYTTNTKYARDRKPRIVINPHKLYTGDSGRFVFEYWTASKIKAAMKEICEQIEIDDYIIRRLDICVDTEESYHSTQKLTRLIVLMLADEIGMENRFTSDDPLTLAPKSLVVANGKKGDISLEIEHYNRSLFSQDNWENHPITNRLEFRAMGEQAGTDCKGNRRTIKSIGEGWTKRLEGLTEAHMEHVIEALTEGISTRWFYYTDSYGRDVTTSMRNSFFVCQANNIYTKQQLLKLYSEDGYNSITVDNLLKRKRYGEMFKMVSFEDVIAEASQITKALEKFTGKNGEVVKSDR